MILVSLGTQDREFKRLLEAIEKEIIAGNIKEKVIVQAGETKFQSDYMEIFDLIPSNEFLKLLEECNILICHGGVGTIIDGLKKHKKIIAAARLKEYGEHQNNHQKQIIQEFKEKHYILELDDFSKLNERLIEIKNFTPKEYESNTSKFITTLDQYIEKSKTKGYGYRKFMQYFFFGIFAFLIELLILCFSPSFLFSLCFSFLLLFLYQKLIHFLFYQKLPFFSKKDFLYLILWVIQIILVESFPSYFSHFFILKMLGFSFFRFGFFFFLSLFLKSSDTE